MIRLLRRLVKKNVLPFRKAVALTDVSDDDELSRFITSSKQVNASGKIKYPAFLPHIPKGRDSLELSLFCTSCQSNEFVWDKLSKVISKPPKGRGIISAKHFISEKLSFNLTPESHPLHIDAVDWPIKKPEQLVVAKRLANKALYDKAPIANL